MDNYNSSNKPRRPIWVYVVIAVIAIGFGVPLLSFLGRVISSLASVIVLAFLAFLLFRLLKNNEKGNDLTMYEVETCSDIQSIDIKLGAGRFVIEQGDGFKIDGNAQSRISGGVWYISRDIMNNLPDTAQILTITIPSYFTAERASITLGAGELLIKGLSAYKTELEVSAGNMEAMGIYTQKLDMKCGVGRIKADASLHGDVDISCGMGDAYLRLMNRQEDFNYTASVGLGTIVVGGQQINGTGNRVSNAGAPYSLNIKCGMGKAVVDFGGVIV